jgi:hypothetical protein
MGPAVPTHMGRFQFGRFQSKFLLMVVPGLVASGIAAAVLYAIHVARAPESIELLTDVAAQGDGLSAEERRELTRQMLKARRENQEEPARVRPTAKPSTTGPSTTGAAEDTVIDAKARTDRMPAAAPSPAVPPLPAARPAVARVRPDSVAPAATAPPAPPASATLPPPAVITPPVATQPSSADASLLPPAGVNVNPPLGGEFEPPPRGLVANVFSSISVLAGSAANATGNSVNWVIDLPGKAISAGGKLLGGDSAANSPPSAAPPPTIAPPSVAPPPATGPPPKRNF